MLLTPHPKEVEVYIPVMQVTRIEVKGSESVRRNLHVVCLPSHLISETREIRIAFAYHLSSKGRVFWCKVLLMPIVFAIGDGFSAGAMEKGQHCADPNEWDG